jgi:hypothetical protein|nr:DUF192 domain-containing protein [Kofleriaceae bacterium]
MRFALAFVALLAACERDRSPTQPTTPPGSADLANSAPAHADSRPTVTFGSGATAATVHVEVVDTEPKIERGLMYRENLPLDDGMLFLLPVEQDWKFWMHNTLIPLDIVFVKRDLTVAGVSANAEPKTDSLRTVGIPSVYVVEVNAGWCASHHVTAGTPVRFTGVDPRAVSR